MPARHSAGASPAVSTSFIAGLLRRAASVLAAIAAAWLLSAPAHAQQGLVPVPPLQARVTDLTGTLEPDQKAALEAKLAAFEQTKGSQVFVLLVPTTQPEDIEQYAIRVADQWKAGRKKVDDGVILIVALNDRKLRIEVGYGLEGALPDATANRIIQQDITPAFRRNDVYGGISTGVDRILRVIEGEPLPEPEVNAPAQGVPGLLHLLPFLLIFALVGSSIFRSMFGPIGGALATGGLVGFITWLLVGVFGVALVAGVLAAIFSMGGRGGGGPRGGGNGWYSRRHEPGWGYSGGFGGFGGGGGGGFGGGGASGSW